MTEAEIVRVTDQKLVFLDQVGTAAAESAMVFELFFAVNCDEVLEERSIPFIIELFSDVFLALAYQVGAQLLRPFSASLETTYFSNLLSHQYTLIHKAGIGAIIADVDCLQSMKGTAGSSCSKHSETGAIQARYAYHEERFCSFKWLFLAL